MLGKPKVADAITRTTESLAEFSLSLMARCSNCHPLTVTQARA